MLVERVSNATDVSRYLTSMGVDDGGVSILAQKAAHYLISIKNLHVGGANILKQDALSIGADLGVPRGTVLAQTPEVDVLLIATKRQLLKLSKKEQSQPFGLRELASKLKDIAMATKPEKVAVMGIINANDDSFFSGSRFSGAAALQQIEAMIEDGATIIDIGGVSSAPNAKEVTAEDELARVAPIVDLIKSKALYERVAFSIDSYTPAVVAYALKGGFSIVNDITGLADDAICKLCAEYGATAVIMHMQGTPQSMQKNPHYENILDEIYDFLSSRIQKAEKFGIAEVVVDIGIGFGKSLKDNYMLIQHLEHFLPLGKKILVGASRKSMIGAIDNSPASERLPGTLAVHLKAVQNGAAILRVHDVKEHIQAIKIEEQFNTI